METSDQLLKKLVHEGLAQPDLKVLEKILRELAKGLGGFGATLWQLRPREDGPYGGRAKPGKSPQLSLEEIKRDPAAGHLYVSAHGFLDPSLKCFFHDLSMDMATGQAVLSGDFEIPDVDDPRYAPYLDRENPFLKEAKPGSMFAVRAEYPDGSIGAVTLYREQKGKLEDSAKGTLCTLAGSVAALYQAVRDRVAYQLVSEIASSSTDEPSTDAELADLMGKICETIKEALGCIEVNVYLSDPHRNPEEFRLKGATDESRLRAKTYRSTGTGITPWVIRKRRPLYVLDVYEMPDWIVKLTEWKPQETITKEQEIHPTSFAAVPMVAGGQLLGVLRCTTGIRSPYYLAEREVELLTTLAGRIAGVWSRWLRMREARETTKQWRTFADEVRKLSSRVANLGEKTKTSTRARYFQKEFYDQALRAAGEAIGGADAVEFALADSAKKTIAPYSWFGFDWDTLSKKLPDGGRLSLEDIHGNAWAHVFHEKVPDFIHNTADPPRYYANVIPQTKQVLFTPVIVDKTCIGVLGVRSWTAFGDEDQARTMMQQIALIVGLYHQLTTLLMQEAQAYQDLEHQIRSPIYMAYKRISAVVDVSLPAGDLGAVRGLLGKARRVVGNIRIFEELAAGKSITVERDFVQPDEIEKSLVEAAWDSRVLWEARRMTFQVERGLNLSLKTPVKLDMSLFEQVISNLLDNAGKYGEPNTEVSISAILDEDRHFRLTVKNRAGVRVEREMLSRLGIRGYRGDVARRRTPDGIGSGLFLVKSIAEAHGGSLIPYETDALGDTRFEVTFPLK